jgi:hypothetical protein
MKYLIFILVPLLLLVNQFITAQETGKKVSVFRDSTDNALDMSDWLIQKKGFLLIPSVITEPAVGYGAIGAAIFFHSSYTEKHGPPSMTGVLGGGTVNGTWMGGAFHIGYWKQDRIRYAGVLMRTYMNLGFYGSGTLGFLDNESINLNLDAWVLFQQIKGRIGKSDFFIGGKYLYLNTDNTLEIPIDIPEFTGDEFSSTLSEVSVLFNYDSRNNVFSPSKGFFIQLGGTYSDTWIGGDDLYGRMDFSAIGYFPAARKLTVGLRYENKYTVGSVPFYARPTIQLRGAPLMKYQNKNTMVFETEADLDLGKRWTILGFAGMGNAYSSIAEFDEGKSVRTMGSGFRYLAMRKLGARMGMDFAASQDDFAFYIVFGTAWLR